MKMTCRGDCVSIVLMLLAQRSRIRDAGPPGGRGGLNMALRPAVPTGQRRKLHAIHTFPASAGGARLGPAQGRKGAVPLSEEGKGMASRQSKTIPEANCSADGVPRGSALWRMLQTSTHVFILPKGNIHSAARSRRRPEASRRSRSGRMVIRSDTTKATRLPDRRIQRQVLFDFRGHPHPRSPHGRARFIWHAARRDDHHRSRLLHQAVHHLVHRPAAARRGTDGIHLSGKRAGRSARQGTGRAALVHNAISRR